MRQWTGSRCGPWRLVLAPGGSGAVPAGIAWGGDPMLQRLMMALVTVVTGVALIVANQCSWPIK